MKKKLLSLAMALTMVCSLIVPASAQTADDRLAAVTARVKATLNLNTEEYTEFYGDLADEILAPTWYLDWSGEEGSLSVSATEEGKILSFYRYEDMAAVEPGTFAPSFPAGDQESAMAAAQAFLDMVLTDGESATLEEQGTARLGTTQYRFYGEILLNGLSAGLSYSIAVRCEDNVITSFYRDDINGAVMGGIPSAKAKIAAEQARITLRDTLALRLEYVLPGDGSKQAVLRYLPQSRDDYYVDAATGMLVNLTELADAVAKEGAAVGGVINGTTSSDSAAAAPEASLSPAEQEGAEKLKGVLERDTLDAKVREITALGLENYTLSTANYTVAREDDETGESAVTATLQYGRQVNGASWRRTVTVDAKTGELIRVYSSAGMPGEAVERTVAVEAAREFAAAFLNQQCSSQFSKTDLYESINALDHERRTSHSFTFAQKENGYFFTGNSIYVGVDATDGSISSYEKNFDDEVTFDSPAGIITMVQALDAWLNTYTAELKYVLVPAAIDYTQPEYKPLLDYGIGYLYKLVLGYELEREDYLLGIDAKTGRAVEPDWVKEEEGFAYSDISGHWAKEKVETLAKYNVGYIGGVFRPDAPLTQLDLIALLASTEGYRYDGSAEGAADELYEYAYRLGLLDREQRSDNAVLTRAATVKLILDAVGYGHVAQLEGIFRTKFADDGSIPAGYYGYVALAQGLGMVSGASADQFMPNANATRAQAAVMLYNLMDR